MDQQEALARKHAGNCGYVCMVFEKGEWVFRLTTLSTSEADAWWEQQQGRARVWGVRFTGETFIRNAK